MEKYLNNFKNCLQKEDPFCKDSCPFSYDIFAFLEKIKTGNFNAAYKTYRNGVGFPSIVSSLCSESCNSSCPLGESINLKKLEQSVVALADKKTPTDYNLPLKKEKIAIIGGGISGLGCLLRLSTKKYHVDLYEKSNRLGGTLHDLFDSSLIQEDTNLQLMNEQYNVYLEKEIKDLADLSSYDAIYIATGKKGNTFGFTPTLHEDFIDLPKHSPDNSTYSFPNNNSAVFFGGEVLGVSKTNALAMGLSAAICIDNYIKTGNINYGDGQKKSKIIIEPSLLHNDPEVTPAVTFTKETAIEEAHRCILCQCNPCQLYCDLASFEKKWPLRMRDEIQATTLPGSSEVKATPAKRLINTCTQCGLCQDTCPKDIDLGGLILEARKSMHRQEKMPWVFNEFWLKDMSFSNEEASLIKAPINYSTPDYLFFPGCQLSASEPSLVSKAYSYLLSKNPSVGIFLGCCGIPASWAGQDDLKEEVLGKIKNTWNNLGKPTFILACPSCKKFFEEFLQEINLSYLYDFLDKEDFFISHNKEYTIFDPCTTRTSDSVRKTIRNLLSSTDLIIRSNDYHEKFSGCCSYGGQSHIANPLFINHIKERRVSESSLPYITYCINCRDSFKDSLLGSVHILDLFFNNNPTNPTITERRLNRLYLKKLLLENYWSEKMKIERHELLKNIVISDELKVVLNNARILEDEVASVIEFCEKTKRVIFDEETNSLSGYKKIGKATYWVEYIKEDKEYILVNAYTHRISIDLEDVWNGEKRINEEML